MQSKQIVYLDKQEQRIMGGVCQFKQIGQGTPF